MVSRIVYRIALEVWGEATLVTNGCSVKAVFGFDESRQMVVGLATHAKGLAEAGSANWENHELLEKNLYQYDIELLDPFLKPIQNLKQMFLYFKWLFASLIFIYFCLYNDIGTNLSSIIAAQVTPQTFLGCTYLPHVIIETACLDIK